MLLCKDLLGTVLRVHDVSQDLAKFEKETILDVVETTNLAFFFLDYPEKNLMFQAGIGGVYAIDYADKKVIAKFKVKGNVYGMTISEDRANLIVASKEAVGQEGDAINHFHKFTLKKFEQKSLKVNGGVKSMRKSTSDSSKFWII